ncbi:MAG: SHOCT domain-containing protein [Nitrososphaerales archaeon]
MGGSKKDTFLKKLKEKADAAAKTGKVLGKKAIEKGPRIGKQLKLKSLEALEESIEKTRKAATSAEKNIELLKKLAELKASGIISEEEFERKKREILTRI